MRRLSVWPPLPVDVYTRRPVEHLPFPLEEDGCRLYSRARHGLWHAVKALGLGEGDAILVPAYHHGSEVEALVRAGLTCTFYEGGEALSPDADELERLLTPNVRALHLTHYLGFAQDSECWRRWCDEHGLLLVDDAAQAWLASRNGRPAGSSGDVAVFCLYKTVGVPDGAAVLARAPLPEADERSVRAGILARRHAAWATGRSAILAALAARVDRDERAYVSDEDFALGSPRSAPSSLLDFLVRRVVGPGTAAARRANYEFLLEELGADVLPGFETVPSGASPFAFPLVTEAKKDVLARAAERRVAAVDFWSTSHPTLPAEAFPRARALRERVVALPVHQELQAKDLERIVAAPGVRRRSRKLALEPIDALDGVLRREWTALAQQSGNIFATWEWSMIWWRHFGGGRRLLVRACRAADGSLVAILPMYLARERPLRILRLLGHRDGDNLAPICRPADRAVAARGLRLALRDLDADIFLGELMPAADGWATRLDGEVLRRTGSPVLHIAGASWDALLARRSANFREQVRRRERKLQREQDVNLRLCETPEQLEPDLDALFELHSARWNGGGTWRSDATRMFHREFAAQALEQGWLRLWTLEIDRRPAAAWYGFRFGDAESYYQSGRDPAWDPYSVGFVLLAHTIRAAVQDGMAEYRFLEGAEPYKYRFADEDPGLETIAVTRTVSGAAGARAAAVAARYRRLAVLARRAAG